MFVCHERTSTIGLSVRWEGAGTQEGGGIIDAYGKLVSRGGVGSEPAWLRL